MGVGDFARTHESIHQCVVDEIIQESDLKWKGDQGEKVVFYFGIDADLLPAKPLTHLPEKKRGEQNNLLFPDPQARYDFSTLQRITKLTALQLNQKLWELVWKGEVTNDSMAALRKGIENKFKIDAHKAAKGNHLSVQSRRARSGFSRWKGTIPFAGNWFQLSNEYSDDEVIESEEKKKERARILLVRYGLIFRELLLKELPDFRWSTVFRSLRLMELSGEITSGCFFHGIPGPQFVSHNALRILRQSWTDDRIYWINAVDPISLAGSSLKFEKHSYPRRISQNYLVFRGKEMIATVQKVGKALTFILQEDDAGLPECFLPLHHLLHRPFLPKRQLTVETINHLPASESPYLEPLRTVFNIVVDFKKITLYRNVV